MKCITVMFSLFILTVMIGLLVLGPVGLAMQEHDHGQSIAGCMGVPCGPVQHAVHHVFIVSSVIADAAVPATGKLASVFINNYTNITLPPLSPPPERLS